MSNLPYIISTVMHVADARIILVLLVVVVLILWYWLIQVSGVLASINLLLDCHRIINASPCETHSEYRTSSGKKVNDSMEDTNLGAQNITLRVMPALGGIYDFGGIFR